MFLSYKCLKKNDIEINHLKQSSWQEHQPKKACQTLKCLARVKPREKA
jgi:hypothetical protein